MKIAFKQVWMMSGTFLNIVTCGFHLGYTSILLRDLKAPDSEIHLSLEAESWVVSVIAVSALPSVLLVSLILQILGRKSAHISTVLPNLIACLIFYFAQDVTALVVARLVSGFTFGSSMFVAALIIGEYTSPEYRGVFLNAKSVSGTLGILMVHLLGIFFQWRTTALIGIIPSVLSILITITWTESPAWLAYKGRYDSCKASFEWLRGNSDKAKEELLLLIQTQRNRRLFKVKNNTVVNNLKQNLYKCAQKDFQKPSLIVLFIYVILESCGRHTFSSYAITFMSAFTTTTNTMYYVIAIDAVVFISCVCSCGIVRLFRRRTILFVTGVLACGLLISICVYLYLKSVGLAPADNIWIPAFLLLLYFFIVNIGVATIVLSLLGEIYPLEHKGLGSIVSGLLFSLSILTALKVTPALIRNIDVHGTFFIYSICMAVSLVCLYFVLPETEGKTLQEIEHHFNGVSLTLQHDGEEQLINR